MGRAYEVLYIIRPDVDEGAYGEAVKKFEQVVQESGGTVQDIDEWGIKTFAHQIAHYDKGYYVLMTFLAPPKALSELEDRLKLDDRVLRRQIVRLERSALSLTQPAGSQGKA